VACAARQGATVTQIMERTGQFLASIHAVKLTETRWTTPEMLALERTVLEQSHLPADPALRAQPAAVANAIRARPSLSDEQQRMVEVLCASGRPVEIVVGHAGTGKTFTLDAVREAFETSGHRVLGASLAARAARELQAGSGIPATTAHALQAAFESGRLTLRASDILVVDEAGMLGTRQLAALATDTARAGAKLILIGDPKQLSAIEAGGLFTALARRLPVVELTDNRRQDDPEERQIATALRHGHADTAIRQLEGHGRLTVAPNSDALRDQLIHDWSQHRAAGVHVVIGAVNRADVRDLNRRAHNLLEDSGKLGQLVAVIDGQRYCIGDQVLALRNRYDLGLMNGDLAEITGANSDGIALRTDNRDIRVPLDYAAEHLQHGYARTVHKSQGLTCDVALLLGDDTLYTELGYTGLTRGRARNHLYAVESPTAGDEGNHLAGVVAALGTSRAKTAAIDTPDAPVLA
jgi:ATP-dependent exoDNAse (exonuclease V) alpha subunit